MVRKVGGSTSGGHSVHVLGLSELVRGKEAIFLTELDKIKELKPEDSLLVYDTSPQYRRSRLYLDALLRRSPATDDALYVGPRGALRHAEYQFQPAAKALRQLRPRILMADGVGLGKTVEVGVLLSELIQRGRADRILVVALKSILSQFQKDLWSRFTIPLVRLDSVGIQRVQSRIPSSMNPFYYFDRAIISIDTLKRDEKYRRYLEDSHWDVVVVDECQHVAIRGNKSQRARLGELLGRTSDALILTSATPHDGRSESFASLINLLEPTAIANPEDYTSEEVQDYFIRRFKKDISHEVDEAFRERKLTLVKKDATPAENAVFEELSKIEFKTIARHKGGIGVLFRTLLLKSFLSSPAACISTIDNRLNHKDMQDEFDEDVRQDLNVLEGLRELASQVEPGEFQKLQALLQMLRGHGFDKRGNKERIVIFSERIDTLKFLHNALADELKLKSDQIEMFHGTLDDQKQQGLVESFGTEASPVRILLASDAASEGINLHYYCHRMVHFDLPWSLITLEQRNGRIDRFGQTETPFISYLMTIPDHPGLKGDLRILERLIEKEDSAHKNLGDVAWLLGLHDATKEEEHIALAIQDGNVPEEAIPEKEEATDFMTLLFGAGAPSEPAPLIKQPLRLMADETTYAREAFQEVLGERTEAVEWHDHLDGFSLFPPEDLLRRYDYLPPELRDGKKEFKLTVDRQRVMDSLEDARQDERKWPEWQLFWEQHPVAEWLDDRVLGNFSRHEAPVLRLANGLQPNEHIVAFQGVVSNLRSQPSIVEWFGVQFHGDEITSILSLDEIVTATGLNQATANPGGDLTAASNERLSGLLKPAVEAAREHMLTLRKKRAGEIGEPLREGLRRVKKWQDRRLEDLALRRQTITGKQGKLRKDQERRLTDERNETMKRYQSRYAWIDKGMRTAPEPYLRVAAVLIPLEVQ
jgi:Helicase conserved C-terminal domain/SNF2-related domain